MIQIKTVDSKRLLRQFIDFPVKLYQDSPYFTPTIYEDEVSVLTPGKNPAQKHCEFKLFLAYQNGKIVGRICAILNHYSNEKYQQKRIRFNRIDMIDDIEVTKALIKAVEDYGVSKGMEEIAGPLGYSDQDKEGLLTWGFDQPNMFVTFYHFPYYHQHLLQLGFVDDATWKEFRIKIPAQEQVDKLGRLADFIAKKFEFRLMKNKNKRGLKPYVVQVLSLMNVAYKDLYGYVPLSTSEMEYLADMYIPILNLDYTVVVLDKTDKVIAFGLMIPSPSLALQKAKGHLYPFGFIGFLRALKKAKVLDMLLVAVEPELQNTGVIAMIFAEAIKNARKNGIEYAETGPELLDNTKVQSLWKNLEHVHHKTRVCMVKRIVIDHEQN